VERRDLLRALGAAAALTLLPRDAEAAWLRLARSPLAPLRALSAAEAAQVAALADVVLPRTDTPSATDVGVVAWVDLIVAEYYRDNEHRQFTDGLAAIDALAQGGTTGSTGYGPDATAKLIDALEKGERRSAATRAWWRLKGLLVHGYFTSERVQRSVLKVNITPGKFDGNAPMTVSAGGHDHG
jgi:hypothetical protein